MLSAKNLPTIPTECNAERQHAGQRSEADRGDEDDAHDEFGDRAQHIQHDVARLDRQPGAASCLPRRAAPAAATRRPPARCRRPTSRACRPAAAATARQRREIRAATSRAPAARWPGQPSANRSASKKPVMPQGCGDAGDDKRRRASAALRAARRRSRREDRVVTRVGSSGHLQLREVEIQDLGGVAQHVVGLVVGRARSPRRGTS